MSLTQFAYQKALDVLDHCARPQGFYASGLPGGYEAVWARDSMITSLGASLVEKKYKLPFARSLKLLAKWQTPKGQIPNCVGSYNIDRRSDKTYNTIDSTLWFIIGHYVYARAYNTRALLRQQKNNIARALVWLTYQDPNEDGLLSQLPTMDWQDAFPHKYGNVINTQALWYQVLRLVGREKQAEHLKRVVNGEIEKYLALFDPKLGYYLPWAWKNHDGDREQEEWFDSLGNVLAILTGLAKKTIAQKIIKHIEKEKINQPYPLKAIWPPIKPGDKEWHSYFSKCDAKIPLHYLNGGVWPFIGGFWVAALVKVRQLDKAKKELEKLAQANLQIIKNPSTPPYISPTNKSKKISKAKLRQLRQKEFNEWLHGKTGKPMGEPYQGWSAGTYVYAYWCVKEKKALFFE